MFVGGEIMAEIIRVLMINGSPRANGNTRACLKNKNCTKRMFYFPFHDKIKKKGGSLC